MTKKGINRLLVIMIVIPIVIALFAGGLLPTIWNGLVAIVKAIVPNFWVLLAYVYVLALGVLLGLKLNDGNKND